MTHPSDEQLRLLLAERLPPHQREPMEQHVNTCGTCQQRLETWLQDSADDRCLLADLLVKGPFPAQLPPPAAPQEIGVQSFGDYEILACLGVGGMGMIYQARHRQLHRQVAIKCLLPGPDGEAQHQERRARLHAEADVLARLQHPNIITLYEVGEHEGRPYLALEWADGGTLADLLAATPQPERQAANWLQTLAEAIEVAHQRGIIHRDLKPANVLLSCSRDAESSERSASGLASRLHEFTLKIADFGVAKYLHDASGMTRFGQALGTPEYMPPEQTGIATPADQVGPTADIYALGVILYEMLTGRPPFRADTPLETLRQVREEEPVPPRCLRPKLARDLETICLKCLHKDPRKRYLSARALADDLRRFLAGEAILARPITWPARLWRWCRRHPSQATLWGLLVLFVLAVLGGLLWHFRVGNQREAEHLANVCERQLPHLQRAVLTTARNEELARLVALGNGDAIQSYLLTVIARFRQDFTLPGESQPFMNLFVLDERGQHLADSENQSRAVASNLLHRDYLRHFLVNPTLPHDAVYFSTVYRSVHDGHYKFAVITRIEHGRRCIGFLAASIPLDARLVAADMHNERLGASIVAPVDWSYAPEGEEDAPGWIVLLHAGYATPGESPRWPKREQLACLQAFTRDANCQAVSQHFASGGGCADYVRIGGTHFVAVVEKDYPVPLCYLLDHHLVLWWLLGLAGAGLGLAGFRLFRRS